MIAFGGRMLVWSFQRPIQPRSCVRAEPFVMCFAIALAFVAALSVRNRLQEQGTAAFNSLNQRAGSRRRRGSCGSSIRTPGSASGTSGPAYSGYPAPNDVVDEALAEAGLSGFSVSSCS